MFFFPDITFLNATQPIDGKATSWWKNPESRILPIAKLSSTVTSGPSQILFPTPWFQVNKQRNTHKPKEILSALFFCL